MKKILTREERDKKVKRNQLIIGGILIFLMIFSTVGYALTEDDEDESQKIEHRGIDFLWEDGFWRFSIQGYDFATRYNPQEVGDIYIENYIGLQDYSGRELYFVGDPDFELKRNLNSFVLRINDACLDENCTADLPVKNCSEDNVIVFRESEKEKFFQEDNCVFIEASLMNQTKYADAYLFSLLGAR